MTTLQIKQLYSTNSITLAEQQQILGGGDSVTLVNSSEEKNRLWNDYANGEYNISYFSNFRDNKGDYIKFISPSEEKDDDKTYYVTRI